MDSDTDVALVRSIEATLKQVVSTAARGTATDRLDVARLKNYLSLGVALCASLEEFRSKADPVADRTIAEPADPVLEQVATRLRGSFFVRGDNLINEAPGWSYRIPHADFETVVEAIRGFAPAGFFTIEGLVSASGIKASHCYRVYVLLNRAGLLRRQSKGHYEVSSEEATRLDAAAIWRHLPGPEGAA